MRCPYCGFVDSKVIDSRELDEKVRRRRQCLKCEARFTTYESVVERSLFVIKKDGRREEFSREKLARGIGKACEKRPLPTGAVDSVADEIERELYGLGKAEVSTVTIGDMVMERLKRLDHIAYIRFASVYREFADIGSLKQAVDDLMIGEKPRLVGTGQLPLIPPPAAAAAPARRLRRRAKRH
ncbi:MAG: transcriptional repressor NrdR [Chloroflexi bacterium]|nr:transcriptional repressor NrdR [Chloroflexota bacterium]